VFTLAVSVPLPLPEAGVTVNQEALSLVVHVRVPPPVLLMFNVWLAGLLPPCDAVNERLVGLVPIAGDAGTAETVNVTGIVTGDAPVALTTIEPL
jgi:hypothetical protein